MFRNLNELVSPEKRLSMAPLQGDQTLLEESELLSSERGQRSYITTGGEIKNSKLIQEEPQYGK
jgi:hypothetical protein